MPYKFQTDRKKIPRDLDRRVKLTEEDRDAIKARYKDGDGIRAIARDYESKCTRRVIQYTIFPERYEILKANAKKRRKIIGNALQVYGRKAWRETQREHRAYKQSIKDKLI